MKSAQVPLCFLIILALFSMPAAQAQAALKNKGVASTLLTDEK